MRACWLLAVAGFVQAQGLPPGKVIPEVQCAADASQSYALYLPSQYRGDRTWSVILAFDPGGRGRVPVERLQAAAETYGYIVAGSNNSRNGPWEVSAAAAQALWNDVFSRFPIDSRRVYLAGFSGGARVAMAVALSTGRVDGVIASSAGFPDAQPRQAVPFAVFGTAGTDDFNYQEMREVDRRLTSAHRVVIFEGGHDWLPASLAPEALGWLELRAMRSGLRPRDEALIDQIFLQRQKRLEGITNRLEESREVASLVADFGGIRDVSAFAARQAALQRDKAVKDGDKKERAEQQREAGLQAEIERLVAGLKEGPSGRVDTFTELRARLTALAGQARATQDSAARRLARRLLGGIIVGSREVQDADLQKLLQTLRPAVFP